MRIERVDPAYLDKIYERAGKAHEQEPGKQQHEDALGKGEQVGDWERTHLQELEESIKKLNETAETFETELRFRAKEESERVTVEAVDSETEEVVREIQPERVINMVAQIQNLIGLFVDTRR